MRFLVNKNCNLEEFISTVRRRESSNRKNLFNFERCPCPVGKRKWLFEIKKANL